MLAETEKKARPTDKLLLAALYGSAGIAVLLLLGMIGFVFSRGYAL